MLNDVIFLITNTNSKYDKDGFLEESEQKKEKVFAECKSTTYKEYYEASRNGEKVTEVFSVNEIDYNNSIVIENGKRILPSLIEYENVLYRIVRRYKKGNVGNYVIELSCEEVE